MTNSNKKGTGFTRDEYSDVWAERMLVTSMVNYPEYIGLVFKLIPNDDVFQDEATRVVYQCIRELYHERAEIHNTAVFQRLRSKDQFGLIRREKISLGIDEMVPRTQKEVCDTAEGILSLFRRHKAYELNIRLNGELSKPNKDSEVADLIYKTYEAITLSGGGNLEKSSPEATKEALEGIDKNMRLKREGKLAGISTGSKKLDEITGGWQEDQVIILAGRTAMGKCLGKGTKVLMFDGSLKKVEDVIVGDKLMGPDSAERNVLSTTFGLENMYWVRQNKAIDYRVNESHILSLKRTGGYNRHEKGGVVNISIGDYLNKSNKFKHCHKGYKSAIEFPNRELNVDPYYFGLWLGDGDSSCNAHITTNDFELVDYLHGYAEELGLFCGNVSKSELKCDTWSIGALNVQAKRKGTLSLKLKSYGVQNNKHIPDDFLYNSRKNRLKLLAGLLDSDGHMDQAACGYEITQKNRRLAEQIKFLADTLGFGTSINSKMATIASIGYSCEVYRVRIWGGLEEIPVLIERKKPRKRLTKSDWKTTGIQVEYDGFGEYFGFEIDGDHLFLLEDCTVTHNTAAAIDFMLSAARSGTPVGFFSMEMPAKQLNYRIVANYTSIPYRRIRSGDISDTEWGMIESAMSDIAKLPIYYFDDVSTKDVRKLEAVATEWRRTKQVGLIFIDYIQYLEMPGGDTGATDRVTKVSKAVKTMQRNLKIPIIALAQLNRNSEGRGDPRPKLADLKDSGQVEQDGSIVIGLFNPAYYLRQGMKITDELEDGEVPFEDKAYCYYVLKNRDGDVVRVDRFADLGTNRFSDYRDLGSSSPVAVSVPVKPFPMSPQQSHDFATNKVFDRLNDEPPF